MTKALISALSGSEAAVWQEVAARLQKPSRQRPCINLCRLSRNTEKGDCVVVPGKVLSVGQMSHPITLGAFSFSAGAMEKLKAAGSKAMSIEELLKSNPEGSKVKLMI